MRGGSDTGALGVPTLPNAHAPLKNAHALRQPPHTPRSTPSEQNKQSIIATNDTDAPTTIPCDLTPFLDSAGAGGASVTATRTDGGADQAPLSAIALARPADGGPVLLQAALPPRSVTTYVVVPAGGKGGQGAGSGRNGGGWLLGRRGG